MAGELKSSMSSGEDVAQAVAASLEKSPEKDDTAAEVLSKVGSAPGGSVSFGGKAGK